MEHEEVHQLTAAYALDALTDEEEAELEAHLRHCERCRSDLTSFQEAASTLAFAAPASRPASALRDRILERARAERGDVVPFRPRWAPRVLAAAAALAAIGVGIWAITLSRSLSDERTAKDDLASAVALLADPAAERVPVSGGGGTLIFVPSGEAALVLDRLAPAPDGKTYEAWVIEGGTPRAAGLFDGTGATTVFVLARPVRAGATVAVTIERAGGVEQPSGAPVFSAETA